MIRKDILIIGSGIAGLSFALKMAKARPDLSICLITKSSKEETNTRYAQGGIAVVLNSLTDSYQQHINDTLKAGGGLCNKKVVEFVVKKASKRLVELMDWGVEFDKNSNGSFETGLEGGHSQPRILHHKDFTGYEIESKLLKQIKQHSNVKILQHYFALDLITRESEQSHSKTCYGAYVLDENDATVKIIHSKITLLATGGSGQIFNTTTNPVVATGDGVAMAQRANAIISEMQFIQFHPTAFYQSESTSAFLISEAVRGFGAYLVNSQDFRFVFDYDIRGELATRDIVSSAIYCEMRESGKKNVFLDCRHLNLREFVKYFPSIFSHCNRNGIDISKDLIPVAPAAHYQCGGIVVNLKSQTSITNLYASGECAYTGMHGSNRLASNSLLEAIVFSHEAFKKIVNSIDSIEPTQHLSAHNFGIDKPNTLQILKFKHKIKDSVTLYAGLFKSNTGLFKAQNELDSIEKLVNQTFAHSAAQRDLWEMKNLLTVAQLIVNQSISYNSMLNIQPRKLQLSK